jgi:23S rRNA (adenine2503-C2)-methyltransferase
MKEILFGKRLDELEALAKQAGMPRYVAGQLCDWLYKKQVDSIDAMTNLSKQGREFLKEHYDLGVHAPVKAQVSADGTRKYLYATPVNKFVEAAYIPEEKRHTLCLSTQVGCKMDCLFCMTGKQGFQGQLSAAEILNQYRSLPERDKITNLVYMGMGEPLDNLDEVLCSTTILTSTWGYAMSPRRITVSTIGIIPAMRTFIEKSECHLAVSLHSPFEEERKYLMPVQTVYPVREVIDVLKEYDLGRQRRISFEYIMFGGLNDSDRHVKELARLLNGLRCRLNLIRFHPVPGTPLKTSDDKTIEEFMVKLNKKGIRTTIRASRGQDISAACGLLSTKELVKQGLGDF